MRGINKSEKKQVIQRIYNLMNHSDDSMVIIINNNITAQVMNETDIKKVSEYISDQDITLILLKLKKLIDTLNIEKDNILFKNIHKSWCEHLMEVKESKYDVSVTYDLTNYLKVPIMKKKKLINIIKWIISCTL